MNELLTGNLFANSAPLSEGERFETLLSHDNVVIERIVSSSHITPTEYVQPQDEWVVLLKGEAVLEVAGDLHELKAGDYLFLPSGTPHTVRQASDGSLWLAVHIHDPRAADELQVRMQTSLEDVQAGRVTRHAHVDELMRHLDGLADE